MNNRFTGKAQNALNNSLRFARAMGHTYIGSEHLLLSLATESDGVAAKLLFKVPLQLALVGGLMWFPVVFAFLSFQYFFYFGMVFIVAYFVLVAVGVTMMMKDALLDCLVEAREEGILTDEREEESKERSENDAE